MKKRLLSLLLALCMVLCLLPTMAQPASAAGVTVTHDVDKIRELLRSNGDVSIQLDADADKKLTAYSDFEEEKWNSKYVWTTIGSGNKTIDLNGHRLYVYDQSARVIAPEGVYGYDFSTLYQEAPKQFQYIQGALMLEVPKGANLVINDSAGKGKIWMDAEMPAKSEIVGKDMLMERNILAVTGGALTVNSGEIHAGRSKDIYAQSATKNNKEHGLIYSHSFFGVKMVDHLYGNATWFLSGTAITAESGSVTINGGDIWGRGWDNWTIITRVPGAPNGADDFRDRCAALRVKGGQVTINAGSFYGRSDADAVQVSNPADLSVISGSFNVATNDWLVVPSLGLASPFFGDSIFDVYEGYLGSIDIPAECIDKQSTLTLSGNTLTVNSPKGTTQYSAKPAALTEPTAIASADLLVTLARGMTLTQDTITCSSAQVRSVNTLWYRDNAVITGEHEVRFGNYLAKVTVYPAKGYRFTANTAFTIGKEKPTLVSAASDGSYAVVWSPLYTFACDHSYNEDWSWHYDEAKHYQQCTVCGERIAEEAHVYTSRDFGGVTTYTCDCGHSYDVENGKTKINGLVVDIPVAIVGDPIPQPTLSSEFDGMAQIMSWHIASKTSGNPVNAGTAYNAGETYEIEVRARALDGYYFAPNAKIHCDAVAMGSTDGDDGALITTFTITPVKRSVANVALPSMAPGTMGDFLQNITATVDGENTTNLQLRIKTHGKDDEVYVRKTLSGGWQLVRGAASLDAFWSTPVVPETAYDFIFDFSTNSTYVAPENINYYSAASYEGLTLEGGETWFTVSGVVVSDSNKVSDVRIVSITPPEAGAVPETDFDVMNTAALDPGTGAWDTSEVFDYDTEYTFTATAKLKAGYRFADTVTALVNGMAARVAVSGDTATVSYTFPATEQKVKVVKASELKRTAIPAAGTAYANTQTVELDGKKVAIPTYALKDEKGYLTNYVRVRDLAVLLEGTAGNYDVDWNSADGIVLTSHHVYEKAHYNGTEGKIPFSGDQSYKAYLEDTLVDGVWQSLTAFQIVYQNGAHTYYQLRDLGKVLGFNVGWSAQRGMFLETDKPYSDAD